MRVPMNRTGLVGRILRLLLKYLWWGFCLIKNNKREKLAELINHLFILYVYPFLLFDNQQKSG